MTRQEANKLILQRLAKAIDDCPDLRMGQIMINTLLVRHTRPVKQTTADDMSVDWKDEYYTESTDILERMERVT